MVPIVKDKAKQLCLITLKIVGLYSSAAATANQLITVIPVVVVNIRNYTATS
jgi:hypothetical protein